MPTNGESKLSQDNEILSSFLSKVDNWINSNDLSIKRIDHQECENILNMSSEDIENEEPEDLMSKAYVLYGYADHIAYCMNREKVIYDYADQSISYIISPIINNYGDQFTKWEVKYNSAIRENPLAKLLNELRGHSMARLTMLQNKSDHIKKMADIIFEISRRRKNGYYSNS